MDSHSQSRLGLHETKAMGSFLAHVKWGRNIKENLLDDSHRGCEIIKMYSIFHARFIRCKSQWLRKAPLHLHKSTNDDGSQDDETNAGEMAKSA